MDKQGVTAFLDSAPAVFVKGNKKASKSDTTKSTGEEVELPEPVIQSGHNPKQVLLVTPNQSVSVNSATPTLVGNVTHLDINMNVDFNSGSVSNGVVSANTNADTWVGLFAGQVEKGDLELQMKDASVISADPTSVGPIRDATGSISGDFIGEQAAAVVGAFEMSEDNTTNHIEGIFVVEPGTP